MGPGRFERPTSPLSGVRSNRLSYGPGWQITEDRQTEEQTRVPRMSRYSDLFSVLLFFCSLTRRDVRTASPTSLEEGRRSKIADLRRLRPERPRTRVSRPDIERSRKEVIQPQVPLRLPCYDFTPVADPTVDGYLLQAGWRTGLRSNQLPWCDGRCVQGPGTYSPRHADPRLLAIPPSCTRVAECNPN